MEEARHQRNKCMVPLTGHSRKCKTVVTSGHLWLGVGEIESKGVADDIL